MFTAKFEFECIIKIEASINVPLTNFFKLDQESLLIRYTKENEPHCIYLQTQQEAADFLQSVGYIHHWTLQPNGEVAMFTKTIFTVAGPGGQPVQYERLTPKRWQDITLTDSDVQKFVARYEFGKASTIMGKVGLMTKHFLKAA